MVVCTACPRGLHHHLSRAQDWPSQEGRCCRSTFYTSDPVKGYTGTAALHRLAALAPVARLTHSACADYPFLTDEQVAEAERKGGRGQGGRDDSNAKGAARGHAENAHLGNAY